MSKVYSVDLDQMHNHVCHCCVNIVASFDLTVKTINQFVHLVNYNHCLPHYARRYMSNGMIRRSFREFVCAFSVFTPYFGKLPVPSHLGKDKYLFHYIWEN